SPGNTLTATDDFDNNILKGNPEFEDAFNTEQVTTLLDGLLVRSAQRGAYYTRCALLPGWRLLLWIPNKNTLTAPNEGGVTRLLYLLCT
ncbi:hypothetical protein KI387_023770, partial [Taxus chinensis]